MSWTFLVAAGSFCSVKNAFCKLQKQRPYVVQHPFSVKVQGSIQFQWSVETVIVTEDDDWKHEHKLVVAAAAAAAAARNKLNVQVVKWDRLSYDGHPSVPILTNLENVSANAIAKSFLDQEFLTF